MQNLKIKVSSAKESKEVQELFFELGYELFNKKSGNKKHTGWVVSFKDGYLCLDDVDVTRHKETTIPQLKDMIILKRNSIEDATHGVVGSDGKYYLTPSSFYEYINGYWECVDEYVNGLEFFKLNNNDLPFIDSEKDVKEYLDSSDNYKLILWDGFTCPPESFIKVPDRMNFAWKDVDSVWFTELMMGYRDAEIVWKRYQQEESINDKVASAEEARQEDKTVQDTLDERQKQYGCFEDVAHVTQGMIHLMRKCGYDRMPQTHQMSLYMICSKMARIVNGDFNHVDSWHDISGYAQLVEKLVKE